MKKQLTGILAALLVAGTVGTVSAVDTDAVTVTVNGQTVQTDVAPVIENDRVLLPMRAIFEALGCNVTYREVDGRQLVTAFHGQSRVELEIGKSEMTVNGETKALDVAAKIEKDRTMVPVRAVSEALNAEVSWDGETRTAAVATKQGDHKIGSVTGEKTVKADDGTVLMYINYVYPVIENKSGNAYIEKINNEYKADAEEFVAEAVEDAADAEFLLGEMGKEVFVPYESNLSFDVHTDQNGILSITSCEYYTRGGAHPDTERESETFDLNNERELTLSDVVKGEADDIHTMVYDVFVSYFEENDESFSAEAASELDKECDNVKFYVTDNSLALYFDVYQVASYAAGYPTAELAYNEGVFKLKLAAK